MAPEDQEDIKVQAREMPDPHESTRPLPKIMLVIVAAVVVSAIAYIFTYQDNEPQLGDRRTNADLVATTKAKAGGAVDGAQIYAANCVACHQATGSGLPGVFPPLAKSEWANGKDEIAAKIVLHGITGPLTVESTVYNGAMPDFKDKLSDAEIAAVLSHVRSSFGNSSPKVEEATVKAAREASAGQKTPWNGDPDLNKLKAAAG